MKKVRQTSIKKASYLIQPNDCRKSVQGPSEVRLPLKKPFTQAQ